MQQSALSAAPVTTTLFDSATNPVFQSYSNYDSELLQLYQLRRQKYTITEAEKAHLKTLFLPILRNNLEHHALIINDSHFEPSEPNGYSSLMKQIHYQIEYLEAENRKSFFFKTDLTNLKIALAFVRYHHGCLMSLNNPHLAFNFSLGLEELEKAFEYRDSRYNAYGVPSSKTKYSAKNIIAFLKKKSSSVISRRYVKKERKIPNPNASMLGDEKYHKEEYYTSEIVFFGDDPVKSLQKAFANKITHTKNNISTLNIVKNKRNIRQSVASNASASYSSTRTKNTSEKQSGGFITFLANLFSSSKSNTKPPIRNLMMQEVKEKMEQLQKQISEDKKILSDLIGKYKTVKQSSYTLLSTSDYQKLPKITSGDIKEYIQATKRYDDNIEALNKLRAKAQFTKSVPASKNISDYSVLEHADANKTKTTDSMINKYDIFNTDLLTYSSSRETPKPKIKIEQMPKPVTAEQFKPQRAPAAVYNTYT